MRSRCTPVEVGARPAEACVATRRSRAAAGRSRSTSPSPIVTVCAAGSSDVTRRPRRTSTRCSAYHASGCTSIEARSSSPRRNSFESGGRMYGIASSPATMRDRSVVPRLPRSLGRTRAGESAADDDEPVSTQFISRPRSAQAAASEELAAGAIVVAHGADERARRRARSLDLHAAQRHAEVLGLEHHPDARAARVLSSIQSAIWRVIRSCTCRSRANNSTTRASFESPTRRSPGT